MSFTPPERPFASAVARWNSRPQVQTGEQRSDHRNMTDAEVMLNLQSNDSEALDILFDRYSRLALRVAQGVVRDSGEAEDVVQDAFFHLYRKSMLFDGSKGTVKNWILQIALHRALDRKAHLARRAFYVGTDLGSLGDTLLDETDLDREIGAKLNRTKLEKAFEELPRSQRSTLELFYFQGLSLREISERVGEPLGNTRHHFYRGLERLRRSSFVRRLRGAKECPGPAKSAIPTRNSG
jgi:RNA polymerase sigma-70 factor (ECF subfamily)